MKKYLLAILFIVVIVATVFLLKNRKTKNVSAVKSQTTIASTSKIVTKTITILPIGDNLSARFITDAFTEIKKYIPSIGLNTFTKFPASAYYKPRHRYRADSLLHWMNKIAKPNEVLLGITDRDISTTAHGHEDFGVMGLGNCPGNAAVASNFRVKNKSEFWKIAIHELGHTTGLPHCPVKTCFMRDAKRSDHTGEEKEFCRKCREHLIKNGWKL